MFACQVRKNLTSPTRNFPDLSLLVRSKLVYGLFLLRTHTSAIRIVRKRAVGLFLPIEDEKTNGVRKEATVFSNSASNLSAQPVSELNKAPFYWETSTKTCFLESNCCFRMKLNNFTGKFYDILETRELRSCLQHG